ncbi:hypothetical protein BH10PSE3_BH10PSE3_21150 [soil metagenome]
MKSWLGVAAIATGVALSGSACAADYYFASASKTGWFFVDLEKVEAIEDSIRSTWTLTIYDKTEERGSAYVRTQGWFECDKKLYLARKFYDYRLDGKVRDYGNYSVRWNEVRPGSVLETQMELVCTKTPNPEVRLGDVEPLQLTKRFREKAAAEKP